MRLMRTRMNGVVTNKEIFLQCVYKIAFKFASDSICNNANISARMPKTGVSKVLKIQIRPGEHAPGPPYSIIHPTATLPHQLFRYKLQPGECQLFF